MGSITICGPISLVRQATLPGIQKRLQQEYRNFYPHELDIRNRAAVLDLIKQIRPDAIIHTAAQPSPRFGRPLDPSDDFDVNAGGTLNLLEGARQWCPEAPFVHMSTNKVYGMDRTALNLVEQETRWDYADPEFAAGINESFPSINASTLCSGRQNWQRT